MPAEPPLIGIATSVGWNGRAYDTFDTLRYAHAHAFPLVQVYLTPELLADAAVRRRVVEQAGDTRLLCHAPALLADGPGTAPAVTAAARDLLRHEADKWVVHHFDETQSVAATLAWVERLLVDGITPCVENFHTQPGADAARRHYKHYVELFCQLKARGHDALAVIDIPRFFAPNLGLSHSEVSDLVVVVLGELAALDVPVIFHLIDSTVRDVADRTRWCPVGDGVLGYRELLPRVPTSELRSPAIILEFDDKANPLPSRQFLRDAWSIFLRKEGKRS